MTTNDGIVLAQNHRCRRVWFRVLL